MPLRVVRVERAGLPAHDAVVKGELLAEVRGEQPPTRIHLDTPQAACTRGRKVSTWIPRGIGTSGESPLRAAHTVRVTAKKSAERWAGPHRRALAFVHECNLDACPRPPQNPPNQPVS